ncbi:Hypothetical predicted protein [Pelobates cultripes]|uniref:Uncharacterized protein n=1 Tax=Pelobates cultripes TaxID=61616 RepID=A0AAD1T559_PELCU|nr:Hypothetical predicted protein [Pelobates cultripes]
MIATDATAVAASMEKAFSKTFSSAHEITRLPKSAYYVVDLDSSKERTRPPKRHWKGTRESTSTNPDDDAWDSESRSDPTFAQDSFLGESQSAIDSTSNTPRLQDDSEVFLDAFRCSTPGHPTPPL